MRAGKRELMHWIGEWMVYGPVRDQLGLRRLRWAYTGGAPLGADTFRMFRGFGINLKQVYGSTETSALVAVQNDDDFAVGRAVAGDMPGKLMHIVHAQGAIHLNRRSTDALANGNARTGGLSLKGAEV